MQRAIHVPSVSAERPASKRTVTSSSILRGPSSTRPLPENSLPGSCSQIAASSVSIASRALVNPDSTNWFESVKFIESVCRHFLSLRYAIPPSRDQLVFAYHDSQAPFAPFCDARRTFQRILSRPLRFYPETGCDLCEVTPHSKSPGHAMRPGSIHRKSLNSVSANRGITPDDVGSACCSRPARITKTGVRSGDIPL
jgi:hypothetical protein